MERTTRALLIIFYRNAQVGRVKTRLAATVGADRALNIYLELCSHTRKVTEALPVDKIIFYSNEVTNADMWPEGIYQKALQHGDELGHRMYNAFELGFTSGYDSICIIGTDCYELNQSVIQEAFKMLKVKDAVIGPAKDGGYYLLGLRKLHRQLFINKQWSTGSVLPETLKNLDEAELDYGLLPLLSDVDVEDDLPPELRQLL